MTAAASIVQRRRPAKARASGVQHPRDANFAKVAVRDRGWLIPWPRLNQSRQSQPCRRSRDPFETPPTDRRGGGRFFMAVPAAAMTESGPVALPCPCKREASSRAATTLPLHSCTPLASCGSLPDVSVEDWRGVVMARHLVCKACSIIGSPPPLTTTTASRASSVADQVLAETRCHRRQACARAALRPGRRA